MVILFATSIIILHLILIHFIEAIRSIPCILLRKKFKEEAASFSIGSKVNGFLSAEKLEAESRDIGVMYALVSKLITGDQIGSNCLKSLWSY